MIDFSSAYLDSQIQPERKSPLAEDPHFLEQTLRFFNDDTPLKNKERDAEHPYEKRPQQIRMASMIAEALQNTESLAVEAPTGVGKSFAYLVPAIYYARHSGMPVIISTETITLQEQLIFKDIPFLQSVMRGTPFHATLAKGRSNYVCMRRFNIAAAENSTLLPAYVKETDIKLMKNWIATTQDGSLSDYPHGRPIDALWHAVYSEGGNCTYPKCAYASKCFYWRARRAWNAADIIVTNHALLFTDIKLRREGSEAILPYCGALILDEAHTMEDAAANHLGIHVSERGLSFALNRLFEPSYARGILATFAGNDAIKLRQKVADVNTASTEFFGTLRTLCKKGGSEKNLLQSDDQETVEIESEKRLYRPITEHDVLSEPLQELAMMLHEVAQQQALEENEDLAMELESQAIRFNTYSETVAAYATQALPQQVYWLAQTDSSHSFLSLYSAPLNVDEILRDEILKADAPPTIMTSATLTVNQKFDYFKNRIGFRGRCVALDSPFDYENQLRIHVPQHLPAPATSEFADALPEALRFYLRQARGGSFVLFTSYSLMRNTYHALNSFFTAEKFYPMMQGESLTRSQMLQLFKTSPRAVLFGTSSFWTGIDVPGDALTDVIIVRLPFPVPSDPLIQARCERLDTKGMSSFQNYSLPEAVIRLRQGAGRLIRSKNDTGRLIILDNRILKKSYGRIFQSSLPEAPWITS